MRKARFQLESGLVLFSSVYLRIDKFGDDCVAGREHTLVVWLAVDVDLSAGCSNKLRNMCVFAPRRQLDNVLGIVLLTAMRYSELQFKPHIIPTRQCYDFVMCYSALMILKHNVSICDCEGIEIPAVRTLAL